MHLVAAKERTGPNKMRLILTLYRRMKGKVGSDPERFVEEKTEARFIFMQKKETAHDRFCFFQHF
ncbi:hypothetical protein XI25_16570 [Paenibacillus sp. DMB20]|nr:hypothetical protein XI25_16570 [Paenibacillus sp. DMB20]